MDVNIGRYLFLSVATIKNVTEVNIETFTHIIYLESSSSPTITLSYIACDGTLWLEKRDNISQYGVAKYLCLWGCLHTSNEAERMTTTQKNWREHRRSRDSWRALRRSRDSWRSRRRAAARRSSRRRAAARRSSRRRAVARRSSRQLAFARPAFSIFLALTCTDVN